MDWEIPSKESHETDAQLHQIELTVDHQVPREGPAKRRCSNRLTEVRPLQPSKTGIDSMLVNGGSINSSFTIQLSFAIQKSTLNSIKTEIIQEEIELKSNSSN